MKVLRYAISISIAYIWGAASMFSGDKHPDILFIAIDDMNDWTTLFDKGNPIQTPNLERLAARGTFFSRAYWRVTRMQPVTYGNTNGLPPNYLRYLREQYTMGGNHSGRGYNSEVL